ncbi:MAG: dihydrofolate reductase family protein [archaeon]|nr:dihydrofolate reductase family protein [archaeon]
MRPFIHINCAMSADGKIAGVDKKQVKISSLEDKNRVTNLKKQYDSVLVGVKTVISDDPHLTVSGLSYMENPLRIVIDSHGKTPDDALILNNEAPTLIITDDDCVKTWHNAVCFRSGTPIDLMKAMDHLMKIGVKSILVEGGGETIASFFREKLVDKFTVFVGSMIIGGRTAPTPVDGPGWILEGGIKLDLKNLEVLGDGVLLTYEPKF